MTERPAFTVQPPDLAESIKQRLTAVVRDHSARAPRSQQVSIGASEIGSPCDRQLALKAVGAPIVTQQRDQWAPTIGTAVHAHLQAVFEADNVRSLTEHGIAPTPWRASWLTETSVEFAPGLRGTADLYSFDDGTVIDHKVPADSTMAKVRRGTISDTYRVQIHCYGLGFANAGYDVRNVAIVFWPRGAGASLAGVHVWAEEFRPDVARAAVTRWQDILNAALQLDLEHHPERASLFATADAPCTWCPYFGYRKPGAPCQGHGKDLAI